MPEPHFLCLLFVRDVLHHRDHERRRTALQQGEAQAAPNQRTIAPEVTFLELVAIYRTSSQLLKKRPVLFRILRRRKIDAVFAAQFFLGETEERAKCRIEEERLTFQVLNRNPDGAGVENIAEQLSVG